METVTLTKRCSICWGRDAEACGCEAKANLTPRQVRAKVTKHFGEEKWQAFLAGRILGLDLGPKDYRGERRPIRLVANVRHVSQSGMLRVIDLYTPTGDDLALVRPKWYTGHNLDKKRDGYRMGGCGMDMTFSLAYSMFEACKRELGIDYGAWPYQLHLPSIHVV